MPAVCPMIHDSPSFLTSTDWDVVPCRRRHFGAKLTLIAQWLLTAQVTVNRTVSLSGWRCRQHELTGLGTFGGQRPGCLNAEVEPWP
jgi:hypothetical protein